jgi:hypothetical protein
MRHQFTPTTFLLTGGLLVWIADFVFVYTFAAVACARGFAEARIFGLPLVLTVTTIVSLLAGASIVWLFRRGHRAYRAAAGDGHSDFIGFVTLATSGLALIALGLLVVPALLVGACVQT